MTIPRALSGVILAMVKGLALKADVASAPLFVQASGTEGEVAAITAVTDAVVGILTETGSAGDIKSVALPGSGLPEITLGGTVSQFDLLTHDATGQAVVATVGDQIHGQAAADGVSGDIIPMLYLPSSHAANANRFVVTATLAGAAAATAANYGKIFTAPRACTVKKITEVHTTPGSDAGAVVLTVERLQGTEASGAGDNLLTASTIDLKGAAETVQTPALTATTADLALAAGDRLDLVDSGTLTGLAGVEVTVELEWDL